MKNGMMILLLLTLAFILTSCSLDATISSISEGIGSFKLSEKNTLAVSPSHQTQAKDEFNQYRIQSTVGEVTSGESKVVRGVKTYRTEINITYQKM